MHNYMFAAKLKNSAHPLLNINYALQGVSHNPKDRQMRLRTLPMHINENSEKRYYVNDQCCSEEGRWEGGKYTALCSFRYTGILKPCI
jgi:hypothetical protein